MSIQNVLEDVQQVTSEFEQEKTQQEKGYNIFQVLGIADKEVLMCRVLADMLNPAGAHGQGGRYLNSFLKDVLGMQELSEKLLTETKIYKEYVIEGDRRIDIVIQNDCCFIPIEVKIQAKDRPHQCYDYYRYAKKKNNAAKLVYLTKWGDMPDRDSIYSKDESDYIPAEDIIRISFVEHISRWLESQRSYAEGVMGQVLTHYLEAIRSFTCVSDEELKNRIVDTVLENEERFRSALQISHTIDKIKAELIYLVMEEFEAQMAGILSKYNLKKERTALWYDYKRQATEQFYHGYSTYPGINYIVKDVHLSNGYELWLRIEIEHNLFAGFCVFDPNRKTKDGMGCQVDTMNDALKKELTKALKIDTVYNDTWWVLYRYLPTGSERWNQDTDDIPNFKHMNEAAISLADAEKRRAFVSKSIKKMEEILLVLLKNEKAV